MAQLIFVVPISFVALLAVNYAFGRLAGHVMADHMEAGQQPWFVKGLHLFVSVVLLMFGGATTVGWVIAIAQSEAFNELEGWLKLVILVSGQMGSVLAAVRGRRLAFEKQMSRSART